MDQGHEPHGLAIDGIPALQLHVQSDDDVDQGSVALGPGTYTLVCPLPGHRAAGMTGTLVVSGP